MKLLHFQQTWDLVISLTMIKMLEILSDDLYSDYQSSKGINWVFWHCVYCHVTFCTNLDKAEVLNSECEFTRIHNSIIWILAGRKRVQRVFSSHDVTRQQVVTHRCNLKEIYRLLIKLGFKIYGYFCYSLNTSTLHRYDRPTIGFKERVSSNALKQLKFPSYVLSYKQGCAHVWVSGGIWSDLVFSYRKNDRTVLFLAKF